MTIEEAIRVLNAYVHFKSLPRQYAMTLSGENITIEACQLAADELRKQQWISVKDRLPEPAENVLIFTDYHGGCVDIGRYVLQGNLPFWARGGTMIKDNVTHWMPLPEPPKEG